MSPAHVVVISLQLPLKAITGPVVTPSRRLSKSSVSADTGMVVISCSCPYGLQKTAERNDSNYGTNMSDNQGQKQMTVSLSDSHPSKHPHSYRR